MFAALAASGLMGSSTKPQGDVAPVTKPSSSNPAADASSSIPNSAQTTAQRRRSQRLAKASASSEIPANNSNTDDAKESTPFDMFETHSSAGATILPSELVPSEMVVDTELQAEFSDDEDVDAEVFDDDIDPDNSISEKTINLSIVEGSWCDNRKMVFNLLFPRWQ
jgi:E3 ubiquitin-protein ligase TRIP12